MSSHETLAEQFSEICQRLKENMTMAPGFLFELRSETTYLLTGISGLLRFLLDRQEISVAQVHHTAQLLNQKVFRLDFLFKTIFAATGVDAGITIVPARTEIRTCIQNSLETFKHELKYKEINVTIEASPGIDTIVTTDRQLAYIVIANLLANSIESTQRGSEIMIALHRQETGISLSFTGLSEKESNATRNNYEGARWTAVKMLCCTLRASLNVGNTSGEKSCILFLPFDLLQDDLKL